MRFNMQRVKHIFNEISLKKSLCSKLEISRNKKYGSGKVLTLNIGQNSVGSRDFLKPILYIYSIYEYCSVT